MRRLEYELFADHFQFRLQDESADGNLEESWTEDAVARLLATAPCTVGVGTVRNMAVLVALEVLETEPQADLDAWDHVVECSLDVPSGRIVIAGCTDYFPDAARVEVAAGAYRARVSYGSLDSVSEDGLNGDDRYRVQLWPGDAADPRILKQRGPTRR